MSIDTKIEALRPKLASQLAKEEVDAVLDGIRQAVKAGDHEGVIVLQVSGQKVKAKTEIKAKKQDLHKNVDKSVVTDKLECPEIAFPDVLTRLNDAGAIPLGYEVIGRHKTLNIALYATDNSDGRGYLALLMIKNRPVFFKNMELYEVFSKLCGFTSYRQVEVFIEEQFAPPKPKETKYFALYRRNPRIDGEFNLWSIENRELAREEHGEDYDIWYETVTQGVEQSKGDVILRNYDYYSDILETIIIG